MFRLCASLRVLRVRAPRLRVSASIFLLSLSLPAQQPSPIRVDVNLVHAIASVRNQSGQLIGSLAKSDFEVYDNGAKQEIAVFEHQTEQTLSVALMIDTSGSTAKELKYE